MTRATLGLLVPGVLVVAGGTALVIAMTGANIASDVSSHARSVLENPEFSWASVSLDMRDAAVTGTATTQASIDAVLAELADIPGLRSLDSEVVLAEFVSPFPFSARLSDGVVNFEGAIPDEATRTALLSRFENTGDALRLHSGAPERPAYQAMLDYGLEMLGHLDQGSVEAKDLDLRVSGRAASVSDFAAIDELRRSGPPQGVRLMQASISPPLVQPYEFTAEFDGATMALAGYAPDNRQAAILAGLPLDGASISSSLVLASGEPANYLADTTFLLQTLARLDRGTARLAPDGLMLQGAPPDAETAATIRVALNERGARVDLEPPRVADYRLSAEKTPSGLAFDGFVPDDVTLTRLGQTDRADVSSVSLARDPPQRFAAALDLGLSALSRMSEGKFSINANGMSVSGRAASASDFDALEAALGENLPQGIVVAATDILPPRTSTYVFSADKAADGSVTLSGFLPTRAVRAEVSEQFQNLDGNLVALADGAPAGFVEAVDHAAPLLAMLDSGRVAFDGTHWTVSGSIADPLQDVRARLYFSSNNLLSAGWTYSAVLPSAPRSASRPIIDPYVWRAQKTGDGRISFGGFVPSEPFRRVALVRAGTGADDSTTLGAGAPAGFAADALAGLDALAQLDEGLLGFSAGNWSLSGKTATMAESEAAREALSGRTDATRWQVAVQALDAPPVASPYTFLAIKGPSGAVTLSGHLLSEDLRTMVLIKAGDSATDQTIIATGEPIGFVADLLAGLDALNVLDEGRLSFDGTRWALSGSAASEEARGAVDVALDNGARRSADWQRSVRVPLAPPPPPPAVAEAEPEVVPEPEPEPEPEAAPVTPEVAPQVLEPAPVAEPEPVAPAIEPEAAEPEIVEEEQQVEAPAVIAPPEPVAAPEAVAPPPPAPVAPPAPEPAPVPETLRFEVARAADGRLVARGAVPSAEALAALSERGIATDGDIAIDTELPADFGQRLDAGLDIVAELFDGRFGFGEGEWIIEGRAIDPAERSAVLASATAGPAADWRTGITLVPPLDLCRVRVGALADRNAILFRSGSDALTDTSLPVIDELAGYLATCPSATVHVEGHTDSDGADDLNLALSVARAEAVVFALMDRGIDLDRLYALGYGESLPIADNESAGGKQRNRRIEFKIIDDDL
jgi:outer membrane protein OmpA-like peptidoglycan-associated protein